MKKIITLLTIGAMSHLSALVITNPYSDGFIDTYVSLMSSDVSSLFVPHNATETYKSIVFTTDGFSVGKFHTDTSPEFTNTFTSFGEDLFFKEVENYEGFMLTAEAFIGFLGNESSDRNKLFVESDGESTLLFDHKNNSSNSATPAPTTARIFSEDPVFITFFHQNPLKGVNYLEDPARFKIFQSYSSIDGSLGNDFLFAIDDREDQLIDHDDGFFFFTSAEITPVPEPSVIGLLSIVFLGGTLYLRRKLKS